MTLSANLWKPKRQFRPSIYITHEGKTQSITRWAKEKGVSYQTILNRFQRGTRGDDLFRPTKQFEKNEVPGQPDWKVAAKEQEAAKATDDARKQAAAAKAITRRERRQQLLAEHQAAFARPLIDAKLLRPKERAEIRERVKFSGQRSWSLKGLA